MWRMPKREMMSRISMAGVDDGLKFDDDLQSVAVDSGNVAEQSRTDG